MKRILLTAFEPFGGEAVNPTMKIANALKRRDIPGVCLSTLTVPVTFSGSGPAVLKWLRDHPCDAVILTGQAGGRAAITPERVAINIDDASIPDNAGDQPSDRPIIPDGPAAYFATLPVKAVIEAIRAAGVPAAVSNSAGTYVCNHLMYTVLHALRGTSIPAGFIHVPFLPEQTSDKPSLPLEDMARAIQSAIEAVAAAL